jgi:hypothetical protein
MRVIMPSARPPGRGIVVAVQLLDRGHLPDATTHPKVHSSADFSEPVLGQHGPVWP